MAPSRSELPADLVANLEVVDLDYANTYGRKPILPADSTPDELVAAAEAVCAAIERHEGTEAATAVHGLLKKHIKASLSRRITKPVDDLPSLKYLYDSTNYVELDGLEGSVSTFKNLLSGTDWSSEEDRASIRRDRILRKQIFAGEHELQLELTDDEWFDL